MTRCKVLLEHQNFRRGGGGVPRRKLVASVAVDSSESSTIDLLDWLNSSQSQTTEARHLLLVEFLFDLCSGGAERSNLSLVVRVLKSSES